MGLSGGEQVIVSSNSVVAPGAAIKSDAVPREQAVVG